MPAPNAETLTLHGPDAIAFAHAQLASDVRSLEPGAWQWSAWLNPQGKVRALLQAMRLDDEQLLLLLRGGKAADLAAQWQPFVLRSRVTIEVHEPRQLHDAAPLAEHRVCAENDDPVLGMGNHALRISSDTEPAQHWRETAIEAGHPWLPDTLLGELLAPALALHRLGAIRLDKGCYPGQEIVARLHYRGGGKQHLWLIESPARLEPGMPLTSVDRAVGHVLDSVSSQTGTWKALAVLRDTDPREEICVAAQEAPEPVTKVGKW